MQRLFLPVWSFWRGTASFLADGRVIPVPVHHRIGIDVKALPVIVLCTWSVKVIDSERKFTNKVIFYSIRLSEEDDEESYESDTDESSDEEVDESTKKKVKWKDGYDQTNLRSRSNIITFEHSSVEPAAVGCP